MALEDFNLLVIIKVKMPPTDYDNFQNFNSFK